MDIKSNYINCDYLCYRTDTHFNDIEEALNVATLELKRDLGCMYVAIYYDDKLCKVYRRLNKRGIEIGYTYDYMH